MVSFFRKRSLKGHRAVITGASSGIGREYARQLAAMGCDLVIVARRKDRLSQLAEELARFQVEVDIWDLDLSSLDSAITLFNKATGNGKIVTILINNAGIGKYGLFFDCSLSDHLSTLKLNSMVPTELTYLFAKHMLEHGRESYVAQIASIAAFQPVSFFSVYSATKGYLRYFAETLAYELRNTNISVSCICPGGTYTEFFEHSGQRITRSGHLTMMTTADVVSGGIGAMLNRRVVYVPGILNKLACFVPRILPRGLNQYLASKTMNRAVERVIVEQKSI